MIARPLIKLIDEAIIPALTLIISKMTGLFLASYFLKLPFEVENGAFLAFLPSIKFLNLEDYIKAENFSNIVMFLAICIGSSVVVARLHFLHESHISPKVQSKLASINLENLILSSYHLYHQASTWLLFTWLTVGFLFASSISGITYYQTSIMSLVIAASLSWLLAKDIEIDIDTKAKS